MLLLDDPNNRCQLTYPFLAHLRSIEFNSLNYLNITIQWYKLCANSLNASSAQDLNRITTAPCELNDQLVSYLCLYLQKVSPS